MSEAKGMDINMKYGFTISEFAKLRNININSLRYYEKIGVLKPNYTDPKTGYRYYTPEQLSLLDVIILCVDLGIPLKQLSEFKNKNGMIQNRKLFETGKIVAQNKIRDIQTGLDKIEYTLRYFDVNQQYLNMDELYERPIIERTFVTLDYTDDLMDIQKIEIASATLYSYAQKNQLSPVFPAGLLIRFHGSLINTKVFFEIVGADRKNASIMKIPEGNFLCKQIDMTQGSNLINVIQSTFGNNKEGEEMEIIVSNMLLDKFQVGTKRSELQRLIKKKYNF